MASDPIHIFYTDDDPDDINIFREAVALASEEVHLTARFDGGDLLQLLENPPPRPAMVFLDWNMPGKDGATVLRAIRENADTTDIPVIILSTSDYMGNINKAQELGANLYIVKPNSFKSLVNTIRHCLTIDWNTFQTNANTFIFKL
jgi:CheY-like chemotaxis protein